MREAKLDSIRAAALVSTGSFVIYVPAYFLIHRIRIPSDLTVQVIFQGTVVTIISLVLYGRAVVILGASDGFAFGALVSALSALACNTVARRMAERNRWGRHRPDLCRCVSGERRVIADL
jgi:hypothetical protein